jgi:hypothetical protein
MALRLTAVLSLAGQTATQTPQPVQSSTATWMVNFLPCIPGSRQRASMDLNPFGGVRQQALVYHLGADDGVRAVHRAAPALDAHMRQPNGHFQGDVALFPLVRADGKSAVLPAWRLPATGRPSPAMMGAVTFCTNSGASLGYRGRNGELAGGLLGDLDRVEVGPARRPPPQSSFAPPIRLACRRCPGWPA